MRIYISDLFKDVYSCLFTRVLLNDVIRKRFLSFGRYIDSWLIRRSFIPLLNVLIVNELLIVVLI